MTCGMTSPARRTITVSPMRMSLRAISSSLCSVAFDTTTPPTVTGSSLAAGVSAPVRPTWISMSQQPRHRLLRRELVGDGPARRARHEAQPRLPVEPVDLVDDAVDVVAERGALCRHLAMEGQHLLGRLAHAHQRIERQAPLLEALVDAGLGVGRQRARRPPAVGEEAQRPARGDGGIELAQRAGRGVPRVGEDLGAGRRLLGVELLEIGVAQIDLAAHLDQLGHALARQPPRDLLHRHDVGGDVLALGAVAARGRLHQPAALVGERDGEPVDLGLGRQLDAPRRRRAPGSGARGR